MIRILFICHGNICRSTMAQSVMARLVDEAGLSAHFEIDSAATSREELGNPPHPGTCTELKKHQVPVVPHRARQMKPSEYEYWDHIVYMDHNNARNLNRMLSGDPQHKLSRLLAWAHCDRDVADPWYTGDFSTTYQDVLTGCTALLTALNPHATL